MRFGNSGRAPRRCPGRQTGTRKGAGAGRQAGKIIAPPIVTNARKLTCRKARFPGQFEIGRVSDLKSESRARTDRNRKRINPLSPRAFTRRSAITHSATGITAYLANGGALELDAREPAHDQPLRPHKAAAHAGRGREDKTVIPVPKSDRDVIATFHERSTHPQTSGEGACPDTPWLSPESGSYLISFSFSDFKNDDFN